MTPTANSKKGVSEDRHRRIGSTILGVVCAMVIGIVLWFADPASTLAQHSQAKDAPYNLLVQGFQTGQLNLNIPPPPGLLNFSNPFDTAIQARDAGKAADMSYYKGKVYMYFGVTPAVVLYWPYLIVTGHYLSDKAAVIILFTSGFLMAAAILYDLRRRYLSNTSIVMAAATMFALALALTLMLWCNFNQVAMSCGFAFTMLALWAVWHALHEPKQRLWWVLLASLAYGLAVGARPSLLFGGLILLLPAAQAWRWNSWQKAGGLLAAAAGPAMLVGLGLMIYNYQRFDNPFEFGWHYQLNQGYDPTTARQFSLHFLWFNFHFYFLEPLRWSGHFPFLQSIPLPPVPPGYCTQVGEANAGLFANYPFIVLALAVPLVWRGRPEAEAWVLRWFMGAIFLLFVVFASMICSFMTATDRYELDFLPALVMLAVVGVLGLERALAPFPVWPRVARGGVGLLAGYSLVYNVLESIEIHASANCYLGNATLANGQIDQSVIEYQKALRLWPDSAEANAGLGNTFLQKGQFDQAVVQYQKALEIRPRMAETCNNLGDCFLQKGQVGDAIIQYQKALEINPDFPEARANLGFCLLRTGRMDDAIVQYRKAVNLQPNFPQAYNNLGNAFRLKGDGVDAVAAYEKAIEQQPQFTLPQTHLAWMLATWSDAAIRNGNKAVTLAEKANELSGGADPQILRTLAAAYAETGRFAEAVSTAQRALALATPQSNTALANELRTEIGLYQNHSPCRSNN
jgi:Flp pilus assembly protein TadD